MTQPPDSPAPGRSRLDPEPVPRRDFLGASARWAAGAACLFAALGIARLPRAAVLPSASKKFRVTLPETMAPGVAFVPPGRSVALYRDEEGVYAISLVCTHLGCIVRPEADGFHCPCHGSLYDLDGEVTRGPAPRALEWYDVARVGERTYVVDIGTPVPAGTRSAA